MIAQKGNYWARIKTKVGKEVTITDTLGYVAITITGPKGGYLGSILVDPAELKEAVDYVTEISLHWKDDMRSEEAKLEP